MITNARKIARKINLLKTS